MASEKRNPLNPRLCVALCGNAGTRDSRPGRPRYEQSGSAIADGYLHVFGLWTGVAFHLGNPLQEAPELGALAKEEAAEFQKSDFIHFDAAIGLNAPP